MKRVIDFFFLSLSLFLNFSSQLLSHLSRKYCAYFAVGYNSVNLIYSIFFISVRKMRNSSNCLFHIFNSISLAATIKREGRRLCWEIGRSCLVILFFSAPANNNNKQGAQSSPFRREYIIAITRHDTHTHTKEE